MKRQRRLRLAQEPAEDLELTPIGEMDVAQYVIFLLAFETYARYVYEMKGEGYTDDLIKKGVTLVRMADRTTRELAQAFFTENVTNPASQKLVARAGSFPSNNAKYISRRAQYLRTIMRRGGPGTIKGLFTGQKAQRQVKEAITASMMDNADAALEQLSKIPMRNKRMEAWIDESSAMAGSGAFQNPVAMAANEAIDAAPAIQSAQTTQAANPGTDEAVAATQVKEALISQVQESVTQASQRALAAAGMEDKAPTTSEVHGMIAATVAAALAAPELPTNIPPAFINKGRPLDPEQMAAALTDGRVLVAAGAGAGKSTTLVSRVAYLINNKGADSGRILTCCFNKKASIQLAGKIKDKCGNNSVRSGTMHSIFMNFVVGNKRRGIVGLGTDEERALLTEPRLISDDGKVKPGTLSNAIRNIWQQCAEQIKAKHVKADGWPEEWFEQGPPSAKDANLMMNQWRGNGVTLAQAKELVRSQAQALGYIWYEMYLGIKGDIPGWTPHCSSKSYDNFMNTNRSGGERLGDMEDMQGIFLDILKRDEKSRTRVQNAFDHILVDEAQDLNIVQHEIFELMSKNVQPGNGKSIWMIGDDKQCIYQFRGSKGELFTAFAQKEGWQTRMIRTNYRCEPEIVDAANKLSAHNTKNLKMECRADPDKKRGTGSIEVEMPEDTIDAAISTIANVVRERKQGAPLESFAVLARTNNELNDFETACIINETPYIRKGGKGFLDARESKTVLGYLDLAAGSSYESMQKSLVAAILMPKRGFLGEDDVTKAVEEAMRDVAKLSRVTKDVLDPRLLLEGRNAKILSDAILRPQKAKIVARGKTNNRPDPQKGEWIYKKNVEELAEALGGLGSDIRHIQQDIEANPNQSSKQLLATVLDGVSGTRYENGKMVTETLREAISTTLRAWGGGEDDDEVEDDEIDDSKDPESSEEDQVVEDDGAPDAPDAPDESDPEDPAKGLGAVKFLFGMVLANDNDAKHGTDPTTADGFLKKLDRYKELAGKLRINEQEWEAEHGDKLAPAVTLSTIHKVKGAEWENVTVMMPKGTFPLIRAPKKGDPPMSAEEEERIMTAERNLAYVALTRAQKNLKIMCPKKMASGRKAGVSVFVGEAGLTLGENVQRPVGVSPPELDALPPPDEPPLLGKTAYYDEDFDIERYSSLYDRRAM